MTTPEWNDPEYNLQRERLSNGRWRGRLYHYPTRRRYSVSGTFETLDALHAAALLQLAELRGIEPPGHVAIAPLRLTDEPYDEYAVLHIGDWHVGKRETDTVTFPERIARVRERLVEIRERTLSAYRIPGLLVAITGDMVDGQGVYPTQAYNQTMPDAREQVVLAGDNLALLFDGLRPYYGDIRIACVPGNHGIGGKFVPESQNYDLMVYDRLADKLAGKCEVIYRPHDPWLLRVEVVPGLYAMLYHGHKKLGKNKTTAQNDIARWSTIEQFAPFHYMLCGHLHHLEYWDFNGIHFFRTGTMLRDDPYARQLGYNSSTRAWLFGVNNRKLDRRVTWTIQLDVR